MGDIIYLVVEDIKSGLEFWNSVNRTLYENRIKIVTCGGIRGDGRSCYKLKCY